MQKQILIVILTLTLISCSPANESNQENQPSPTTKAVQDIRDDDKKPTPTLVEAQEGNGSYQNYNSNDFEANADKKRVLFFHASWCPSCRQMDETLLAQVGEIPNGLAIFKVDYDAEIDLRQQHGVTLQHTLVEVDANGNQIQKWNALYNEHDLESILNRIN